MVFRMKRQNQIITGVLQKEIIVIKICFRCVVTTCGKHYYQLPEVFNLLLQFAICTLLQNFLNAAIVRKNYNR